MLKQTAKSYLNIVTVFVRNKLFQVGKTTLLVIHKDTLEKGQERVVLTRSLCPVICHTESKIC